MPRVYAALKLGSFESLATQDSFMFCGKLITKVTESDGTFSLLLTQSHYVDKLENVDYLEVLEARRYNERLKTRAPNAPKRKCPYR